MPVTIHLPEEIERQLRDQDPKLDETAREQFLIAEYVAGKLSTGDITIILGLETRSQAEQWLGQRGVHQNYSTSDLEADRQTLTRLLGPVQR